MNNKSNSSKCAGNPPSKTSRKTILAISSGGGHWVQLQRLQPTMTRYNTIYATVDSHYRADVLGHEFHTISDTSLTDKSSIARSFISILILVLKVQPTAIVSTGAAPGIIALLIGKLAGCNTVWIDSFANTRELSISGKIARFFSDIYLTQWPNLARKNGPYYIGNVLCYS